MARYFTQFLMVFVLALGLVAAFNVAVDPNAAFRWSDIRGFNDQKTLKGEGARAIKSLILSRHPFDVLFFGTSQGEVGLDPSSPVLQGARAFNASLSYTNMYELSKAAAFAAKHQRPQLVVIALDFISFSGSEVRSGDFASSAFAGADLLPLYIRRVFSGQTLKDSFSVVRKSMRGKGQFFGKDGRVDPTVHGAVNYPEEFRNTLKGYVEAEARQATPERQRQNTFPSFAYSPQRVRLLQEMVARFESNGAQVLLFVTPVHAWYLEALTAAGLLPVHEQWKRDLVAGVQEINKGAQRPVRLWDFSGYSAVTTEPVPNSTIGTMRWYWDPSHFKKETGDLMLARMLGRDLVPDQAVGQFGTELTPASIDAVLAATRQGHTMFMHAFSRDVTALGLPISVSAP